MIVYKKPGLSLVGGKLVTEKRGEVAAIFNLRRYLYLSAAESTDDQIPCFEVEKDHPALAIVYIFMHIAMITQMDTIGERVTREFWDSRPRCKDNVASFRKGQFSPKRQLVNLLPVDSLISRARGEVVTRVLVMVRIQTY